MKISLTEPVDLDTLASDAVLTDTDNVSYTRDPEGKWYIVTGTSEQHPTEPPALDPFTPHLG